MKTTKLNCFYKNQKYNDLYTVYLALNPIKDKRLAICIDRFNTVAKVLPYESNSKNPKIGVNGPYFRQLLNNFYKDIL
jgi:hypothetical protein